MAISYDEALNEAKKKEAFARAGYNYIRQQYAEWVEYQEERRKNDPQYKNSHQESKDNEVICRLEQEKKEAYKEYNNAQAQRFEIEQQKQNEVSRQNEQNNEYGRDDNQMKNNEQFSQHKNNDNEKNKSPENQQQQKILARKFEHTR